MNIIKWNSEKNEILAQERGITFDEIVQKISAGGLIVETAHPNKTKYLRQRIMIVDVDGYAFLVPYVINGDELFLKTIISSRKATRKYLES